MAFGCASHADEEVAIHQKIGELAVLDPGLLEALHLVVHGLLEAARRRADDVHVTRDRSAAPRAGGGSNA